MGVGFRINHGGTTITAFHGVMRILNTEDTKFHEVSGVSIGERRRRMLGPRGMVSVKDQVVELERGFWEKGNDPEYFQDTMADSCLTVFEPAGFIDKKSAVKMVADAKAWTDVKMQDVTVVELAPDAVALAYHGSGKQVGGKDYRGSIQSVYVRQGDRWKLGMTVHQPWPAGD